MKKIITLILVLLLVACTAALADTIVLKTGERVSGSITKETKDSVTLETGFGELTIPRAGILRIEKDAASGGEYEKKCSRLARKHRELAKWCEDKGLAEESERHASAANELDAGASEAVESHASNEEVLEAVWKTVREKFYDRKTYNGCDWGSMKDKYLSRAKSAKSKRELYDVCNEMLSELKASHCYLWSPYVWKYHVENEFKGEKSVQLGIEILKEDGAYFVRTVYDGGPSADAGVEVGEELVTLNGTPAGESELLVVKDGISTAKRLLYTIRAGEGESVSLGLRRRRDGIAVDVKVAAGETSMLEAAKNSIRVDRRGGRNLGYIHLWHFMNRGMVDVMREAISGPIKDCDGLVLDIRGRGGSPYVIREVLRMFTGGIWAKPTVLVVDEDTSSAKELFAHYWKSNKLGPVVGRTTAGHVLGSGMTTMPDGSVLLLAMTDVRRMTRGVSLEGKGVEPDVKVEKDFKYCAGSNPVVEKAFEVLKKKLEGGSEAPMIKRNGEKKKAA